MRDGRIVVCIVLLAVVLLLNLPPPMSLRAKAATRDNLAPFQNFMSLLIDRASDTLSVFGDVSAALAEKREMQEQIGNLRHRLGRRQALETENSELRELLGFRRASRYRLLPCEIIARGDSSGWWQSVRLNRGSDDGIQVKMAVISSGGLVGRTMEVSRHVCDVLLITDANCKVACKLAGTKAYGIVGGTGISFEGSRTLEMLHAPLPCEMLYLNRQQPIAVGDEVVTSGLGGVYPEGLPLGHVARTRLDPSGLYQRADVIPAAEMNALRYLFVVLEDEPEVQDQ